MAGIAVAILFGLGAGGAAGGALGLSGVLGAAAGLVSMIFMFGVVYWCLVYFQVGKPEKLSTPEERWENWRCVACCLLRCRSRPRLT